MTETLRASCHCGAIHLTLPAASVGVLACHCADCQKMHGNFNAFLAAPMAEVTVKGLGPLCGISPRPAVAAPFCGICGARVLKEVTPSGRWLISAGLVDGPSGKRILKNLWETSKPDWYDLPGNECMNDPVTITVRRRVKPGREAAYEAWLKRLTEGAARDFTGYLGAEFHRPGPDGTYRSVFRFDSLAHLEAFEQSAFRAAMLAEGADLFAADAAWERMTGLEFWFDPPRGTRVPQPSPHRMALVLIAVVFALVLALNLILGL